MTFYNGSLFPQWKGNLFVGGHGTRDLVRLTLNGEKITGEERLLKDLQPKPEAIRDVRTGPDGALYVLTDGAAGPAAEAGPEEVGQQANGPTGQQANRPTGQQQIRK